MFWDDVVVLLFPILLLLYSPLFSICTFGLIRLRAGITELAAALLLP